jgi:hypothetical protein
LGSPHLVHARVEHVEALLALAAADDLADAGRQHVHRGDGAAVVVLPHVERLDVLGVVHHRDRALDDLLGEVALVLGLQVHAPRHRELELLAAALEDLDRLGVVHAGEGRLDERVRRCRQARVDVLLEERQVVGALGQHVR